jgi:hypothetical protein
MVIQSSHDYVNSPIVIEICEGSSTMQSWHLEIRPCLRGYIHETPSSDITTDSVRLGSVDIQAAVGHEKIWITVIV